ncbi:uncharacterized protein LY79DRAFT_571012 [Colletotrichum navitas]|uniref:Fungal N-terminal domain-containing protein n=1 Tax=Colletotrichum navitas TaxID=681940 RepID=A0AAD8PMB1_9PEZI|nr:uncharacterized protein LY79DRAFT_571012 [Colletotrichum navitas]KAK1569877.1 hypothetical protein LY79DRAFT_571012 [Colletotrichum navitas]
MEATGLAFASASLAETALKLYRFTKKIQNAPNEWERYRELLENFRQLLEAVKGLTDNMDGLDKVVIQRDNRKYGLIDFCMENTILTLNNATSFLNKFESLNKGRVARLKERLSRKGNMLKFVIQDEDVAACIRNIETAMAGLGIAIHAISLARTNDGFNENRLAIGDLTKQLSDALEKIDKRHQESITREKQTPVRYAVETRRRKLQRFLPSSDRQRQTIQAPEISSVVGAVIPHPELRAVETPIMQPGLASVPSHHSEDQGGTTRQTLEENPEALAAAANTSGAANGMHGDEAVDDAVVCVRIPQEASITHVPADKTESTSDAQRLVDFLRNDEAGDEALDDDLDAETTLIKVQSCFVFRFKLSAGDSENDEPLDTAKLRYLCVKTLIPGSQNSNSDGQASQITAQKPCNRFPLCEHIKIDQLDEGKPATELLQSDMGHVIFISDAEGLDPARCVPLFSQIDGSAYIQGCGGAF